MHHIHYPHAGTKLSTGLHIHETSDVVNSHFGEWTSVGPSNKIFESSFGDYTYTMDDVTVNYAEIGKFGNIASHACINPVQHPMDRVTQHHMTYRRKSMISRIPMMRLSSIGGVRTRSRLDMTYGSGTVQSL